jgi:hypothetical protein
LRSLRSWISSGLNYLVSRAMSRWWITSIAICNSNQALPNNLLLELFNGFATCNVIHSDG